MAVIWDCPVHKGKAMGKAIPINLCLARQRRGDCDRIECKHKIPPEDGEDAPQSKNSTQREG